MSVVPYHESTKTGQGEPTASAKWKPVKTSDIEKIAKNDLFEFSENHAGNRATRRHAIGLATVERIVDMW